MGAINIDNTGTGGDITLSSDGTSLLLGGTAVGGGADLYAANESSPTAQPSATGANAVAIGDQAIASGDDSLAFGEHSDATAARSFSFGFGATATHTGALALGTSRAFAVDAVAIGIDNNSTSYGASGANSVAIGQQAKASGQKSLALGYFAEATGLADICIGDFAVATGGSPTGGSVAIGSSSGATQTGSVAIGLRAYSNIEGKLAFTNNTFNNTRDGSAQYGLFVLKQSTTDATASTMVGDNNADTMDSPSTTNQIILPNNSAYSFSGTIVVREDATDGDDYAGWEIKGVIMRGASASTTTLGVGIVNSLYHTAGLASASVALSADTTNGGLKIEVTGIAATNLRWVATVHTSEVVNA